MNPARLQGRGGGECEAGVGYELELEGRPTSVLGKRWAKISEEE
jgi:hypothetical protein